MHALWDGSEHRVLVADSGIEFHDRGEQELRGVPGTWRLFAVRATRPDTCSDIEMGGHPESDADIALPASAPQFQQTCSVSLSTALSPNRDRATPQACPITPGRGRILAAALQPATAPSRVCEFQLRRKLPTR